MGQAREPDYSDLHLEEDLPFQHQQWRLERIGWCVMAAVVAAALLGLFGGVGPLNHATRTQAELPRTVTYQPFVRVMAPTDLEVRFAPAAEAAQVWFSDAYLAVFELDNIVPAPLRSLAEDGGVRLTFSQQATHQPAVVHFTTKAREAGVCRGEIGIGPQRRLTIEQFVYP